MYVVKLRQTNVYFKLAKYINIYNNIILYMLVDSKICAIQAR